MKNGLGFLMSRRRGGGGSPPPPAFSPADLFLASEVGFWGDVTPSRLWQDTARTTPVTAAGQEVASWELSTASGVIYAEQATTGKGPTYQEDTGIPYLDFDGSNDCLVVTGVNLSGTDKLTIVAGVRKDSDAATGIICEYSANPNTNNGTFGFNVPGSGASSYGVSARVSASSGYALTTYAAPIDNVVSVNIDLAQATAALEFLPRVDGVIPTLTLTGAASAGNGNFGNHSIFIGQRNQATLPFNGRLTGLIIRGALTTGTDLTNAEDWATPNFP